MTLDEQIIALGTLDGYTDIHGGENGGLYWRGRRDPREACVPLPDYDSLDVIHRMEMIALDQGFQDHWLDTLVEVVVGKNVHWSDYHCFPQVNRATAAQRREALLRTLSLWKTPQ